MYDWVFKISLEQIAIRGCGNKKARVNNEGVEDVGIGEPGGKYFVVLGEKHS